MAGLFCNPRVTGLIGVLVALAVVRRIDGHPYHWPDFVWYGNAKEPIAVTELSKESNLGSSVPQYYDRVDEPLTSSRSIRYVQSSLSFDEVADETRVDELSIKKPSTGLEDDEDRGKENDSSDEAAERDDEEAARTNVKNDDENGDDAITRLIEQAIQDDVFMSPDKWAHTLPDKPLDILDDEGTLVKIQKPRSPGDPETIVTQSSHVAGGDRIVFPGDAANGKPHNVADRPVPSCENMTFCLNTPYYPSDHEVDIALKTRFLEPVNEPASISERIGPMDDDSGLCVSREQVIQPKTALDDNNEWRYIINNEKYVQTVRVEICEQKEGPCRIIDDIASGYKTICKQKFIYRHLVALGSNGTESVPFQIPSSCCCHVKFVGDVRERFGGNFGKSNPQTPVSKGNMN